MHTIVLFCCGHIISSCRFMWSIYTYLASLVLGQWWDYTDHSEVTLKDMGKFDYTKLQQLTTKHKACASFLGCVVCNIDYHGLYYMWQIFTTVESFLTCPKSFHKAWLWQLKAPDLTWNSQKMMHISPSWTSWGTIVLSRKQEIALWDPYGPFY